MSTIIIANKTIILDREGFLLCSQDWNAEVAFYFAQQLGIALKDEHFAVIKVLQEFYTNHETLPTFREMVGAVKTELGVEKGKSIYLYQLFPGNPMKHLCNIAGLPKPKYCM